MKTGIRTFGWAIAVVAMLTALVSGCTDNGLVAPTDSTLRISANPATVVIDPNTQVPDPDTGRFTGTTQVDAMVIDANGFPMEGISVVFRTTAGTLASGGAAMETDANGVVSDTLTVTDLAPSSVTVQAISGNLDETTTVTVAIVGDNILPSASFTTSPQPNGWVGEPVTFDGSASTDPDGAITCYQWEIRVGGVSNYIEGATQSTASWTYQQAQQNIDVTLRVSDNPDVGAICGQNPPVPDAGGNFSPLTATENTYQILERGPSSCTTFPVARIISDNGIIERTISSGASTANVTLDGSTSFSNGTAPIVAYTWDCGQSGGQPQETLDSEHLCIYAEGIYTASLYVTDSDLCQSAPVFVTVIVNPAPAP